MGTSKWKALKDADGKGGVRYREHETRKHGAVPDRYYVIAYWWQGKTVTEGVGWASDNIKPSDAFNLLRELKRNQKTGGGPCTKAEKDALAEARKKDEAMAARAEAKRDVAMPEYFSKRYMPENEAGWKPETARKAREHMANWIEPVVKGTPMREVGVEHVKRLMANLSRAGRSPRTVQYVLRTFAMIWAAARDAGIVDKPCPTKAQSVKKPRIDNERQRYLTAEEAEHLLTCVRVRSPQAADMTLVALEAGLRFSEVAGLTWGAVDMENGVLRVLNTKGKKDRYVPMTSRLKEFFAAKETSKASAPVFPNSGGGVQAQVPSGFWRGLADSQLNEDVEDAKLRVGFHVLRHTYASRLVQQGVDLYRVQRLLGHSTPTLTARYAKLADDDLRDAVEQMERREKMKGKSGKVINIGQ